MAADLRLLSVHDYHHMVETVVLASDERVELIAGQLYKMAAEGTTHSAAVTWIEHLTWALAKLSEGTAFYSASKIQFSLIAILNQNRMWQL
jgi:Uma2 family endonuclease